MPTIDVSNFYSSPPPRPVVPGGVVPPPPGGSGQGGGALAGVKSFWSKLPTWGKVLVVIGAIVVIWVIWHSGILSSSGSGGGNPPPGSGGNPPPGSGGNPPPGSGGNPPPGSGGNPPPGGSNPGGGGAWGGPGSTEQTSGGPSVNNAPSPTPSASHSSASDIFGTGQTAAQYSQAHPRSAAQVVLGTNGNRYQNPTQHAAGVTTGAPQVRAISPQMRGSAHAAPHPKSGANYYHPKANPRAYNPRYYRPKANPKAPNPSEYRPQPSGTHGHPGVRRA